MACDMALRKQVSRTRIPPQGLRAKPDCVAQLLGPRGVQIRGRKTGAFLGPRCSFSYTWAHFDAQKTGPRNGRAGGEKRPRHLSGAHTTRWGGEDLRQTQTQTDRDTDTDKDRKTERQTARHTDPARQHHLHSFGFRGQHDQPTTAAPGQRAHSLNTRTHTDTPTIQRRPL